MNSFNGVGDLDNVAPQDMFRDERRSIAVGAARRLDEVLFGDRFRIRMIVRYNNQGTIVKVRSGEGRMQ